MDTPWAAEEIVTPELAAALVAEQFPALAPLTIAILSYGRDVGDAALVREGRRALANAVAA
jgi:hypothetical protein